MTFVNIRTRCQTGSALIISLVFLLLLSVVGIASIQNSTLEERMAGNAADKGDAFQVAEATLRLGENFLAVAATADLPTLTNVSVVPTTDDYPTAAGWKPVTVSGRQNYYRIQRLDQIPGDQSTPTKYMYRITAIGYGVGGAANGHPSSTRVVLQSTFQP